MTNPPTATAARPTSSRPGAARIRRYAAPVRWREDVGWELRCPRCAEKRQACFWPLTDEFWHRNRMQMCRACERERNAAQKRYHYQRNPVFAEHIRESVRRFYRENPSKRHAYNQARWAAVKADPILLANERARVRKAQKAYRERQRLAKAA